MKPKKTVERGGIRNEKWKSRIVVQFSFPSPCFHLPIALCKTPLLWVSRIFLGVSDHCHAGKSRDRVDIQAQKVGHALTRPLCLVGVVHDYKVTKMKKK